MSSTPASFLGTPNCHAPARWLGVGASALDGAWRAGAAATAAALQGRDPALVIVFASVTYDLARLLDGVRSRVGAGVDIVGCSTCHHVVSAGAPEDRVAVIALGGPGFQVRTAVSRGVTGRCREAGVEVAASLDGIDAPHHALLLLMDGLVGAQHEVIRGAYSVAGAGTPLVGGCAGDDLERVRTSQFFGTGAGVEVLTDAAVSVALGSDAPIAIATGHGWRKSGEPMIVTSAGGGRLYELDGEPALAAYLRRIGQEVPEDDGRGLRRFPMPWPLGLSRRSGEDIRTIYGFDPADGSLACLADIPPGALAWRLEADVDDLVRGAEEAVTEAIALLGGREPLGVLLFDCGIRQALLGPEGTRREVEQLALSTGAAPFAGFYTYGEIARTRGSRGLHHLTMVALALA